MSAKIRSKKPVLIDQQLRESIAKSGLTAYRIANEAGIAIPVVARFISGERDLRLATAAKVAYVLGLELRPIRRKAKP
jgi:plasmid maintenance system antidote protein VapI